MILWETYYPRDIPKAAPPIGSLSWKVILRLILIFRCIIICRSGMRENIFL